MTAVPRPGPVHGLYPQRPQSDAAWLAGPWRPLMAIGAGLTRRKPRAGQVGVDAIRTSQAAWTRVHERNLPLHLHRLRARLAREGWQAESLRAQALGCAAALMQTRLGRNPFDTQLMCAELLLSGCLSEMATGEGKTLAVALAAAVAALAGVPVHAMTANDYLARRDAGQLAPFFHALGLSTGVVQADTSPDARRLAYACDITYCTAREVAFDHLRDRQQLQAAPTELQQRVLRLTQAEDPGQQPLLLRGLCMALVDEADSLLIDEATMPLVLAEAVNDPRHRAWCFQALALARELELGRHVEVDALSHQVRWTDEGRQTLDTRAAALGGAWLNSHHRLDLAGSALVALHALRRDEHYLVTDTGVQLLDAYTGRLAQGRVWSRSLQSLVELKECRKISPPTQTRAQTSYQRFFSRYWHLAGNSGSLLECRRELASIYGLRVVPVPLRLPSQRRLLPARVFRSGEDRLASLVQRVRELRSQGRPVLVGVATVAQAQALSAQLQAAHVAHQVLDARHDQSEAAVVARAGQAGQVTVATAMAGRGTDIHLGPGVAAGGGLHVIVCQDNRSARLDRQFIGRCARQGDPGSAELWHAPAAHPGATAGEARAAAAHGLWPPALALGTLRAWQQALNESRDRRRRRRVLEVDLSWETRLDFKHLHA